MLVVTLAESTFVHEADRLQADLRRAGIEPFGWIINASLATSGTSHTILRARAAAELAHIEPVQEHSSRATSLVGRQPDTPEGTNALRRLAVATAARSR